MLVARTPTGRPVGHQPTPEDQRAPALARLGTSGLSMEADEVFLSRFGDVIDDRIAEILDELLDERNARRPPLRLPHIFATVSLTLALAASVLLRHSPPRRLDNLALHSRYLPRDHLRHQSPKIMTGPSPPPARWRLRRMASASPGAVVPAEAGLCATRARAVTAPPGPVPWPSPRPSVVGTGAAGAFCRPTLRLAYAGSAGVRLHRASPVRHGADHVAGEILDRAGQHARRQP